jgi:biopolymer transport protein ExbB
MIDYLQKGGPLVWLLLACSVVALATFFERWAYFHRASLRVGDFLRGLHNLVARNAFNEALHEAAGAPGPVARVVHAALARHDAPREELKDVVQQAGQLEVPELERGLTLLGTITFLAPMIGLLGTVIGLIDAFSALSAQGAAASAADVARGVYQALLTAAGGIAVAIPSGLAGAFLSSRVNALIHDMERGGIEIVNIITDHRRLAGEIIAFQPSDPAQRSAK